jgi:hypothetical protein
MSFKKIGFYRTGSQFPQTIISFTRFTKRKFSFRKERKEREREREREKREEREREREREKRDRELIDYIIIKLN